MLTTVNRCSVECWRALDDLSKYITSMSLLDLIQAVHDCVMCFIKIVATIILFSLNSSVMGLGVVIAFAAPQAMREVTNAINRVAVELILKKERLQVAGLIVGSAFAFGFAAATAAFFIGANRGLYLRSLAVNRSVNTPALGPVPMLSLA